MQAKHLLPRCIQEKLQKNLMRSRSISPDSVTTLPDCAFIFSPTSNGISPHRTNVSKGTCTCPDYCKHRWVCKHLFYGLEKCNLSLLDLPRDLVEAPHTSYDAECVGCYDAPHLLQASRENGANENMNTDEVDLNDTPPMEEITGTPDEHFHELDVGMTRKQMKSQCAQEMVLVRTYFEAMENDDELEKGLEHIQQLVVTLRGGKAANFARVGCKKTKPRRSSNSGKAPNLKGSTPSTSNMPNFLKVAGPGRHKKKWQSALKPKRQPNKAKKTTNKICPTEQVLGNPHPVRKNSRKQGVLKTSEAAEKGAMGTIVPQCIETTQHVQDHKAGQKRPCEGETSSKSSAKKKAKPNPTRGKKTAYTNLPTEHMLGIPHPVPEKTPKQGRGD